MNTSSIYIHRALISVSNKSNILAFARALYQKNIQLIASNGTAKILIQSGLKVTTISQFSNYPEMMHGRIKTLHTKIYAGILAQPNIDNNLMKQYSIDPINMVIVNFYPFINIKTLTEKNFNKIQLEEYIDIGGPSLVRAAAKNYKNVTIVVNINDYHNIINELNNNNGKISLKTRLELANKAFQYVTNYDNLIENYFKKKFINNHNNNDRKKLHIRLPNYINYININFKKKQKMRYGENPHQSAMFYTKTDNLQPGCISTAKQLQGKELSYNNILDLDTALECVKMFSKPTCVIVKHGNPCSAATHETTNQAYEQAYQADPISAFGGIIAFNKPLDKKTAQTIINNQFAEAIIAPSIHNDALQILIQKHNIRVLSCGKWHTHTKNNLLDIKQVNGGLLIQNTNTDIINMQNIEIVTKRHPTNQEINDAIFCWKIVKFVKSNAIVYGRNNHTIAIGSGQTSRIHAVKIANLKAQETKFKLHNITMASDAFFPFTDGIDNAASMGITCIIQPGGGIQNKQIIQQANKYNISMIYTHIRHFRH